MDVTERDKQVSIRDLRSEVGDLQDKVDKLEAENASLNARLDILTDMLARAMECRR